MTTPRDNARLQNILLAGPSYVAPSMLGSFGFDVHAPGVSQDSLAPDQILAAERATDPVAFDARWRTYRGLGLSNVDGVAVLDIVGVLTYKMSWWRQGYDELAEMLAQIEESRDFQSLLLNIHSPGGMVAGCMDACDAIYNLSQRMPTVALVADCACSAAYALASQAGEIVISQTGVAGSIGVLMTHTDYSKQNEMVGLSRTEIFAGEHKTLGSPERPITDDERARMQAETDILYSALTEKVARGRDGMSVEDVVATQAGVYYGEDAVSVGLADRVASGPEVLAEMLEANSTGTASVRSITAETPQMTTKAQAQTNGNPAAAAAADTPVTMTVEQLNAMIAAGNQVPTGESAAPAAPAAPAATANTETPAPAAATPEPAAAAPAATPAAEAPADPAAATAARIQGILTHAEAAGRTEMANHLAFNTDMTVEAAAAALAVIPKAAPNTPNNDFAAAMNGFSHDIGADGEPAANTPNGAPVAKTLERHTDVFARRRAETQAARNNSPVATIATRG